MLKSFEHKTALQHLHFLNITSNVNSNLLANYRVNPKHLSINKLI